MNNTYLKNILRDIRDTKGKVISIATMVGLAAAVVVGLTLSGTTMRNTLNQSLETYGHPDLIIRSTYGLDYEDELIVKRDSDIEQMTLVKTADLMHGETLVRIKSYSKEIPKSVIIKGRMPEKPGEIAIDIGLKGMAKIGDEIDFSYVENSRLDDEVMENLSYRVVGYFRTSDFFMEDMRKLSYTAKKELDGYAYVLEENFDTDKYGEINISYKDTSQMDINSSEYRSFVYEKKDELEDAMAARPKEVLANVKKDVNNELDDAQAEIDDAKEEISDAEKKLRDARADLDQGFEDYLTGKEEFTEEIASGISELESAKAELEDGERRLRDGRSEYERNLQSFNREIANAEREIAQNEQRLRQGQRDLEAGQNRINEGYSKLETEFTGPRAELQTAKNDLDKAQDEIEKNEAELNAAKNQIETAQRELEQKSTELDNLENTINAMEQMDPTNVDPSALPNLPPGQTFDPANIDAMKSELLAGRGEIEAGRTELAYRQSEIASGEEKLRAAKAQYQAGLGEYKANKDKLDTRYASEKAKLDAAQAELNQKKNELDAGLRELSAGKNELANNREAGRRELDNALAELNRSQAQIDNGWADYNEGLARLRDEEAKGKEDLEEAYEEILDGEEEYDKNKKEFEDEKQKALDDIAEGEEEIADGKDALLRLADPEYDVETIYDNEGIKTYHQNSLNMDELTKVFPTFFYLVAMLVTLTTMKRYIDEQRTINGTLKALGYSDRDISGRFYLYGIIPTFIGSVIGAIAGRYLIANIIINAYSSGFGNLGINYGTTLPYIIFAIVLSVGLIALTVYFSSRETVRQTPANLLRPKAPNVGKKILLERINPLWKRMSFMQKITARNLFRYKARMFMTLFGVGGCTALTFFGFAMIDSITNTVIIEQDEISHYDVIAMVDEKASDEDMADFRKATSNYKALDIRYETATIKSGSQRRDVNIVVASDASKLDDFVHLRTPKGEPVDLTKEEATLTEKASKELGLSLGDKISFSYDGKNYELPITNIVENYTGDYIYIGSESFEKITGEKPTMNASYLIGDADGVIKDIEDQKAVVAIINASVIYASIDVLLANLNLVIGVITLISVMLALVVLYNLININVSERKRELATIKVLGFYPKEVTSYIFREIFILTLLGILVGYGLGYAMFRYIIYVVAPEDIMLFYGVYPRPFVLSGLITIAISLVLLLVVHRKLKAIDMAEAMGSGAE